MKIPSEHSVGVIVGRFQVPALHAEHRGLINLVQEKHAKVILFIGCTPLKTTSNNPLDYQAREQMIKMDFPNLIILPIFDCQSNDEWSNKLDSAIRGVIGPGQKPLLYGGRDSFIKHYTGKFSTQELVPTTYLSGSEIRNGVGDTVINSSSFRAGVIWASQNQYPKTYACVDIAIFNKDKSKLLMARKPGEKAYRFVGGFSDPSSMSFEDDAKRELLEETTIRAENINYVGSTKIDDWRYKGEKDKIITSVFYITIDEGSSVLPQDDICELRWFNIEDVTNNLVPTHLPIKKLLSGIIHGYD